MSRPIIILIVAISVACLYGAGTYNTYRVTGEMLDRIEETQQLALSGDTQKAQEALAEMEQFWEKKEELLTLYIRHNDIDYVKKTLAELPALIQFGDPAEFCSKLDETRETVNHIWESELPLVKNIL